ncbi:MAG: hypothetical protein K6E51_02375 [Treponema sp.]|nr:hypothetical protein [Treponema sp.]
MKELQTDIASVVSQNHTHDAFMDSLQQTAIKSNDQLVQIQKDNHENTEFMEHVLTQMNENQQAVLTATKETEKENLQQVQTIASRAAQNTIHTGDQLSFLFQLRKIFERMEANNTAQ